MKSFKQFIISEAQATEDLKQMTYYHGTTRREAALGIAKNGIKAPTLPPKKNSLTPVEGKVYVTPHIHYAQIYGIGGDYAGSDHQMTHHKSEPHGYVFAVHGSKLGDVQPDEDSVGEAVHNKKHGWLNHMANTHLGDATMKKVKEGDYSSWARAGKTLVKKMSNDQKLDAIRGGAHVAHHGTLEPDAVYRIHHSKIPLLKRDGSNFFEHAEKIDPKDI